MQTLIFSLLITSIYSTDIQGIQVLQDELKELQQQRDDRTAELFAFLGEPNAPEIAQYKTQMQHHLDYLDTQISEKESAIAQLNKQSVKHHDPMDPHLQAIQALEAHLANLEQRYHDLQNQFSANIHKPALTDWLTHANQHLNYLETTIDETKAQIQHLRSQSPSVLIQRLAEIPDPETKLPSPRLRVLIPESKLPESVQNVMRLNNEATRLTQLFNAKLKEYNTKRNSIDPTERQRALMLKGNVEKLQAQMDHANDEFEAELKMLALKDTEKHWLPQELREKLQDPEFGKYLGLRQAEREIQHLRSNIAQLERATGPCARKREKLRNMKGRLDLLARTFMLN